jgi:hypothetical protein
VSRSRSPLLALVALALLAGCDRPFVPLDPPAIEVVGADLGEVQTADRLPLALRVTAVRGVTRVTVNGEATTFFGEGDLYLDTLALAPGLNTFAVEAEGADGNTTRDTLYALRLPLQTGVVPSADLPDPRALHAATRLPDGAVLVSGGVGPGGEPAADLYRIREATPFSFTVAPAGALAAARAGHTASLLPDGRVLVLGGAVRAEPRDAGDFLAAAEVVDPATGASMPLPGRGEAVRRSGHAAFVLQAAGRTFVYLVGGRGPLGGGVGTPSSVVIAEFKAGAAGDSLVTLTPAGGAGTLAPVTAPAAVALPPRNGNPRALVAGLYAPDGLPVASRLVFLPGGGFYPFQVLEAFPAPPETPRDAAALAPLGAGGGLALLLGGRDATGAPSARLDVYADDARRFFRVPPDRAALRGNRFGHTATLLPSGRMLVVGGFTAPGAPTHAAEIVYSD